MEENEREVSTQKEEIEVEVPGELLKMKEMVAKLEAKVHDVHDKNELFRFSSIKNDDVKIAFYTQSDGQGPIST